MSSLIYDILDKADNFDYVKIIDTDSVFVMLQNSDSIQNEINDTEQYINSEMVNFMDMHNMNYTDFIRMRLKNEMYIPRIIAFSKKRYIANSHNMAKNKSHIEIKGIEGKRATNKFVLDVVEHLKKYIQQESVEVNLKDIFYDVYEKIEESIKNFKMDYISLPINPPRDFGKLKTMQGPTRGMLNFDIMIDDVFSKVHYKGLYVPIYITPHAILNNQKLQIKCDEICKKYQKTGIIKMEKKKKESEEEYICRYIKDMTIPEPMMNAKIVNSISDLNIRIDFIGILKTYFKKFILLFSPIFIYDPHFDFKEEGRKIYKHVVDTYYNV